VLENGRLVAQGTHEELVRRPGPYQDAARIQLVDLALENAPEEALT